MKRVIAVGLVFLCAWTAVLASAPSARGKATYEERYLQAANERLNFVVFVGMPSFYVPKCILHEEPRGTDYFKKPGVYVSKYLPGAYPVLKWVDTLPASAGPEDVLEVLSRKVPEYEQRVIYSAPPLQVQSYPFLGGPSFSSPTLRGGGYCPSGT